MRTLHALPFCFYGHDLSGIRRSRRDYSRIFSPARGATEITYSAARIAVAMLALVAVLATSTSIASAIWTSVFFGRAVRPCFKAAVTGALVGIPSLRR